MYLKLIKKQTLQMITKTDDYQRDVMSCATTVTQCTLCFKKKFTLFVGSRALSFSGPLLSLSVEFCGWVDGCVCLFVGPQL